MAVANQDAEWRNEMTFSMAAAIVAFIIGAYAFFRSKYVEHRIVIAVLLIVLTVNSFLYDNASYIFGYCRHADSYSESTGTMMHYARHPTNHRAKVSYYDGDTVIWASVPVAFYESLPRDISIMVRDGQGSYAKIARTQIIVTGRTLILISMGVWILLACMLKPSPKKRGTA